MPCARRAGYSKVALSHFFVMPKRPEHQTTFLDSTIDFENDLNEEQRAVVRDGDGPCVVLAGAGSGKTRTIVYRVAYLIERGVPSDRILLLTFTNKAANEMMTRIASLLKSEQRLGSSGVWGGTFHAVANRILRAYAEGIGYRPNFTIFDQDDSKSLIKTIIREMGLDDKAKRFPSAAVVQHIVSYARNSMRTIEDSLERTHPKLLHLAHDIAGVADRYDTKKRMANAMDFDDLLVRLYELLASNKDICARLQERFQYILVDEYQDTNAIQAALVRKLAGGEHSNVLVVGDDAQSIYSFRAADVRNILDFSRFFREPKIFRLETNYRSVPEVLDLANDIISRNVDQYPKELKSVAEPHVKPSVVSALSANQEAELIVTRIEWLMDDGVPDNEIAVLFRATHHSQRLEFELMRRGVQYEYRGGMKFFERAHVKDVLSFLRIADNFTDEAAWRRVLLLQQGIGEVSASKVFAIVREQDSLAKTVLAPIEQAIGSRVARGWRDLKETLEKIVASDGSPSALVRAVLKGSYPEYLENEYPNASDRLDDVEQLAEFAEQYTAVSGFLAEVALDDAIATREQRKSVRGTMLVLSTIHQAKGLEWDAVFIMHMNESSFPNRKAALEDGGLEEERRLFYVAVTRARRHLWMTYPTSSGYDAFSVEQPSMFLQEVDPSRVDTSLMRDSFGSPFSTRKPSSSFQEFEDGYEEDAIVLDEDGEVIDPLDQIKSRMKGVHKEWKKKSFLRDV